MQIKGIREGLLISLGEGPWEDLQQTLLDHLDQQGDFLRGARLALDVGNQELKAVDLGKLRQEISEREISLWALLSNSPITEQTAQTFGLATRLTTQKSEVSTVLNDMVSNDGDEAVLIRRTLRSGFSLQFPGHVVVIGDVNPGAEIIAGGNIVIWGRLKGTVHAGAEGDPHAVVCALDLSPTQLRIADKIALTPKRRGKPSPEIASVLNDQVVAEQWYPKRDRK